MSRLFSATYDKIERLNTIHDAYSQYEFYNQLGLAEDRTALLSIAQHVDDLRLRFSIIGEFSSGKSTFINAILRKDILPAAYRPTTIQVMQIEHDDEAENVSIENQPRSTRSLTKEGVAALASETKDTGERLLIQTPIPKPMDRFILFDTPGVNDPALLSEEVIFDLLGESDVIVFLMRADNALKRTEASFLEKLVLKKDLSKFFFVINFSDTLTNPQELPALRKHVARGIADLVQWPEKDVLERVFTYSAKESLAAGIQNATQREAWKHHTLLLDRLADFATKRREELEASAVQGEIQRALKSNIDKLSIALEQTTGKQEDYQKQLSEIENAIKNFNHDIQDNMTSFRAELRKQLRALIDGINSSFEDIKRDTFNSIASMSDNDLEQSDWIQKHIRKQVEDAVQENMKKFWTAIDVAAREVDKEISPALNKTLKSIEGYHKGFDPSSLMAATGVVGVGYVAAATLVPWVIGGMGILGTIGAAVAFFNPAVLPVLLGASQAGLSGVSKLFSTGIKGAMLSYQGLKDPLSKAMASKDKANYAREISRHIDEIKRQVIGNIENSIDSDADALVRLYIESKFPQKADIEKRHQADRDRTVMERAVIEREREKISSMQNAILNLIQSQNSLGVQS
jgi:GTPase Era involved in 16S rRNA processing